jgi:hypothetical protein
MGIIITSPSLEYERLSLELSFSYLLNLKVVRFNSYAEELGQLVTAPKNG